MEDRRDGRLCAASPDWDGLTLAAGPVLYDQAHPVWGHNVFACLLIGGACGLLDYQFDIVTRVGRRLLKLVRLEVPEGELSPRARRDPHGAAVWAITAVVVALSHLVGDLLVSGSSAYADWGVQILWPLTDRAWVYPRVPWGDVGITLVFVAGAALMLWRPQRATFRRNVAHCRGCLHRCPAAVGLNRQLSLRTTQPVYSLCKTARYNCLVGACAVLTALEGPRRCRSRCSCRGSSSAKSTSSKSFTSRKWKGTAAFPS